MPESSDNIKKSSPLFILGSGRSGTTLLQRVLNSHSEICIWGEHSGFLAQIAEAYFNFSNENFRRNVIIPNKNNPGVEGYLKRIRNPINWSAWYNWLTEDSIKNNFKMFLESFFNPAGLDVSFWGFKEICYGLDDKVLEFLKEVLPDAKFVFVVRNPVDTISSQIAMFYKQDKKDLSLLANKWALQNNKYFEFNKNNPGNSVIIRYEDIVSDNEKTLNKLFSFLSLQCAQKQSEIMYFDSGRGADPRPYLRRDLLNENEMGLLLNITRETALKFNYSNQ